MVLFCFCWFLALYGLTFILAKSNDIFSPIKFISVKYAVLNLCFILYICFYPDAFKKSILRVCNVTVEQAFLQYTIIQTIAYLSLIAGILMLRPKKTDLMPARQEYSYGNLRVLAMFAFAAGMGVYGLFLSRIGGLMYLLNNLNKRVELQGNQYILGLLPLLVIAALLLLACIKLKNKAADKLLFGFVTLTTLLVFNSFGGRLPSLIFIIILVVARHYMVAPLKLNKKNILAFSALATILFFYVLAVPVIRQDKNSENTKYNHVKTFVYNVSYTYIDVFAANYFNESNAWRLKGFFDPVSALFAQKDKSMIPQVDQGVYFRSIVKYKKDFAPPMPRKDVSKVSWPTENFGFAYANFLIPGVVVFFFLQGVVFALAHRAIVKGNYHPVLIMLYVEVIFNFNFSSLRLAHFIKILPLLYVCYVVFNKFVKKQSVANSFKIKL